MLLKDLLSKYNGKFYVYEGQYDEDGNLISNNFITSYVDFTKENRHIDRIKKRKVHNFYVGKDFLNIYLECRRKTNTDIMDENIEFLELSTYIRHSLYRAGINTIGELCSKTYNDIRIIRCIGKSSMEEIVEVMEVYGLHFKEEND